MNTYKYKGITKEGATSKGVIRAYDEYEAAAKLKEDFSIITSVELVQESNDFSSSDSSFKLKDKDLAIICSQFSIILKSGMPIMTCVEMVARQATNKEIRARLEKVAEDVGGGYSMAQSFENNVPNLPVTFIETVRAGEQSGTLDSCFSRLFNYYDKSSKTKGKVAGALTYPAIVIAVAIVVIVIIMTVAVPLFTSTFATLGTELPGITKGLIAVSNFFVRDWWILLLIAVLFAIAYLLARRDEKGRELLAEFSLYKAPLHNIKSMNCSATFASTMSTMLSAGLPVVRCLEVTSNVVDNYVYSKAIKKVRDQVEQGRGIAESMKDSPAFPRLLTEMTGVGERSGTMESTLDVVADYYNNEVALSTDKLLSIMEPAITIGLAFITCVLLLSVYLPMFSMYGSISA